eukprot:COSAG06_NODE_1106_length_10684_cov_5.383656_9_plen_113_part_00
MHNISLQHCTPQHKPSPGTCITLVFLVGCSGQTQPQEVLLDEICLSVYSVSIRDRVLVTKRNGKGEAKIRILNDRQVTALVEMLGIDCFAQSFAALRRNEVNFSPTRTRQID